MGIDLETETTAPPELGAPHARLARLVGDWRGTSRTIFKPGSVPLEARWEGRLALVLGGRFARFTYRSSIDGQPIAGELTLAYETGEKHWRLAWIDSFHTGTTILVSTGEPGAEAIDVRGTWFAGEGHPHWGWRTIVDDAMPEALTIRMYNVPPPAIGSQELLGVDVALRRVHPAADAKVPASDG